MPNLKELIKEDIGNLFEITDLEHGYTRARGPFLLPDGDTLDVYCKEGPDGFTATDLADGSGYLWMSCAREERLTPELKAAIDEICKAHRAEFERGCVIARAPTADGVADAIFRVGLASMRVADLYRIQPE